ncbi:hypothetical protein EV201_1289 [Ancylomarina subtilis]|uniref:Uncharacterized protein n=1 Tax=Ancylomarina subtilis TaxID=1639035 RepID=A0A4Q7VKT2_9BACT|nr:hypothetical protein [Ancylomarina subtilis]RZT96648.1 hypothetical protein EV201_1289 [Ancylomarina subtilis]
MRNNNTIITYLDNNHKNFMATKLHKNEFDRINRYVQLNIKQTEFILLPVLKNKKQISSDKHSITFEFDYKDLKVCQKLSIKHDISVFSTEIDGKKIVSKWNDLKSFIERLEAYEVVEVVEEAKIIKVDFKPAKKEDMKEEIVENTTIDKTKLQNAELVQAIELYEDSLFEFESESKNGKKLVFNFRFDWVLTFEIEILPDFELKLTTVINEEWNGEEEFRYDCVIDIYSNINDTVEEIFDFVYYNDHNLIETSIEMEKDKDEDKDEDEESFSDIQKEIRIELLKDYKIAA